MDITFTLIMLICLYPVLWIMLGIFISAAKWKKDKIFSLSLPPEGKNDPDVALISRHCRRNLWLLGIPFTLAVVPFFFIPYVSVVITCWLSWALLVILVPPLVFQYDYRAMQKLKKVRDWTLDVDEESRWLWGMFYYDPGNPKTVVKKRIGTGTTWNMARPAAKILTVFSSLCLLGMPFLGVWTIVEDFTPMEVMISETAVTATHLNSEIDVSYDDVSAVVLLREMPRCRRSAGTSLTYLEKGRYKVDGYGSCRIIIDRRDPVILVLETAAETYLISLDGEDEAEKIINRIEF